MPNPKSIDEALGLTRRDMDLEKELDNLDYYYRNARSTILNEQARIKMRLNELVGIEKRFLLKSGGL